MAHIETSRFGKLEYYDKDLLLFPEGIPGFTQCTRWIIAGEENHFIKWMQSVEYGDVALPVTSPEFVDPKFHLKIHQEELDFLGAKEKGDLFVLVVVRIPPEMPWEMTANLAAPVVLCTSTRKGRQVVGSEDQYSFREYVFPEDTRIAMAEEYQKASANPSPEDPEGTPREENPHAGPDA